MTRWATMVSAFALLAVGYAVALLLDGLDWAPVTVGIVTGCGLLAIASVVALLGSGVGTPATQPVDAPRHDPLTGLLDRRGFQAAFDVELERARRSGTPLSLVVLDVDRFARVNERHGRGAGDALLRRIGRTLDEAKRGFDHAARVGGEEFAVLIPDSGEDGAYAFAERVRAELGDGEGLGVTASFGIATFPQHGQSMSALLQAADQALYAAQRGGRNRTVISSAEVPGVLAASARPRSESAVELSALLQLAAALDERENGSASHSRRVARFAELTARELGLPPEGVERVRLAGVLHDVGRLGLPDELVRKPGALDEEEWRLVRAHPEIGQRLLATTTFDDLGGWIRLHHVRPDGNGYPSGTPWEQVPLEARILAVADAYEAMTSERAYRSALAPDVAARELRQGAGRQFDGEVVDAFLRVV